MNADVLDIAATMKDSGQSMTLTRTVPGDYDPVAGTSTGGSTQAFAIYGIVSSYKDGVINQPGSLILTGDKKAIIDAVNVTPLPGDSLTIAGTTWKIMAVDTVEPAGVALLHKCQVRK